MNRTDAISRARIALVTVALAMAGCEQLPLEEEEDAAVVDARAETNPLRRELAMNQQWQNHRYSELLAAMGKPTMVMHIPGGGNPPGFAVVFGQDPRSGCIDAFALMYASDPIVRQYHCR